MKKTCFMMLEDICSIGEQLVQFVKHCLQLAGQFMLSMILVLLTDRKIPKGKKRSAEFFGGRTKIVVRPAFQKVGVVLWTMFAAWIGQFVLMLTAAIGYMFSSALVICTIPTENIWMLDGIVYDFGRALKDWIITSTRVGAFMDAHPANWCQFAGFAVAIIGIALYVWLVLHVFARILTVFLGFTYEDNKSEATNKTVVSSEKVTSIEEGRRKCDRRNSEVV